MRMLYVMRKNAGAGKVTVKRFFSIIFALIMVFSMVLMTGCGQGAGSGTGSGAESAEGVGGAEAGGADNDIVILFTSDIHCGVDQGWGLAGLQQIRDTLEAGGTPVLLVDNGDAIQGEPIGTLSQGKAVADLMSKAGYDAAIPGNHEFDYGMDNFLEIAENADYPYISCNLNKEGKTVLDPYVIREAAGKKIAFVGVTTPTTITSSAPKFFQDENGNFIYDFMQSDQTGQAFYDAIQASVDAARADGADYVILLGHLGMQGSDSVWDYASVAENTSGIDAILDGHSHDCEQVLITNKDGKTIPRSACGTKMECIGWARIDTEDGKVTTGLYDWNNDISATELLGIDNDMSRAVDDAMAQIDKELSGVLGETSFDLTIIDPDAETEEGQPIRIVRRAETNLGDLITDAFRDQTGAEIAMIGGGAVRASIPAGEITRKDVVSVMPFNNDLCVAEVTGHQILDALEFGTNRMPGEFGGFLQVSGVTYEIDMSVPASCTTDENGMFTGVAGERRVKNVMVGGQPIDPAKTYTLAAESYLLKNQGDGMAMFSEDDVVSSIMVDNEALMKYIEDTLGGVISEEYSDPYGQGRIVATGQ